MRYRLLGRTGLYVSEICLGTMTYGGKGFWGQIGALPLAAVVEQLKFAVDAGVNFIDTANIYSFGESERLVGAAIKELALPRDSIVVATKATASMDESPNGRGQSRYHLFNEVDASLKRLQLDHIDLYQLHAFDPLTPFEESLGALDDLVRSGKVRYIGLCNMSAWHVMKALAISERRGLARFESVQAFYTIASRDLERELVPLINDQKLGLMVWSPLAGGLLTGKYRPDQKSPDGARRSSFDFPVLDKDLAYRCVEVMRPIADRLGVTIAQVALAWLLAQPAVSTVIVGAKSMAQLKDNLAATRLTLPPDDLRALDAISALRPEYPGWMVEFQGQARAKAPFKE